MDVWRYSDWDGYGAEVRESQPHIWRWRDWIVESLNADKGYDRMVVEMLAADEAAPDDPAALRATGFLVRNWYKFNRNVWLDNTVEHTAKAFLGLTLNCARCHDHKYDPIAQADYYRFRAFFEPHDVRTDRVPGQPDAAKDGLVRVYDAEPDARRSSSSAGDEKRPVKDRPLGPGRPARARRQAKLGPIAPVALRPTAYYPGFQPFVRERDAGRRPSSRLKAREDELAKAEKDLSAAKDPAALAKARGAVQVGRKAVEAAAGEPRFRPGADRRRPGTLSPAAPGRLGGTRPGRGQGSSDWPTTHAAEEALAPRRAGAGRRRAGRPANRKPRSDDEGPQGGRRRQGQARPGPRPTSRRRARPWRRTTPNYSPAGPRLSRDQHGRRLALARWIVDRENPLTARVAVNHIWMRHFGTPLVPTVFDFGLNGKPPTHPGLARLAGRRVHGFGLEHEGDPPADRHQQRLPDAVVERGPGRSRTWPSTRRTRTTGG